MSAVEKGLVALPTVPDDKWPNVGKYDWLHSTTEFPIEQLKEWWSTRKTDSTGIGYICGRVSGNLAVLDIENAGLAYRARLENDLAADVWAKISAWEEKSAGGIHLYFRLPYSIDKVQIKDENGLAIELLCQGNFCVGAPTRGKHLKDYPHKSYKKGEPFSYEFVNGGPENLATLTDDEAQQLFEALRSYGTTNEYVSEEASDRGGQSDGGYLAWVKERINELYTWEKILTDAGCKYRRSDSFGRAYYEIPGGGACDWGLSVNKHTNRLSCFAASLEQFKPASTKATYNKLEVMAGFELKSTSAEAVTEIAHRELPVSVWVAEGGSSGKWPTLSPEFYKKHPILEQIYKESLARAIPPDSVLAGVLAHASYQMDYRVMLPGGAVNNLFVGLIGKSGKNKGRSLNFAAQLMPETHLTDPKAQHIRLGTGEGISKAYYGKLTEEEILAETDRRKAELHAEVDEGDEDHELVLKIELDNIDKLMKTNKGALQIVRRHAFMRIDEGEAIEELSGRNGATLGTSLRSAASGEALGFGNASDETRLPVPQYEYRLAVVMGIQPEKTKYLLDESTGGTPQRFVWVATKSYQVDKEALKRQGPTLAPPKPLNIRFPDLTEFKMLEFPNGKVRREMVFAPEIEQEIWEYQVDNIDDTHDGEDELLSQKYLNYRKVAASLAFLFGETEVTLDTWALTHEFMRNSDAVRDRMVGVVKQILKSKEEAADARAASRASAAKVAEKQAEQVFEVQEIDRIARRIAKHLDDGHECQMGCLNNFLGRDKAPSERRDAAIEDAQAKDWVKVLKVGNKTSISKGSSIPA